MNPKVPSSMTRWFKENFDRRIALGMLAIVAGAVVLSWPEQLAIANLWPALAILGACLAWGIDNNLTRKVALHDASWIAAVKGLLAGSVNLGLALLTGSSVPELAFVSLAMLLGFLSYGLSLVLFVIGLRHLGTARTGAYFSVAPLVGAAISVVNGEPVTASLLVAGGLMALGVWLHVSDRHEHIHRHEATAHSHEHVHDEHHQHEHDEVKGTDRPHRHWHIHEPMAHSHEHFPDTHHQHKH